MRKFTLATLLLLMPLLVQAQQPIRPEVNAGRSTGADPTWNEGTYVPLSVDNQGRLRTTCNNCGGTGGTAVQDGAAFAPDITSITPVGGYRDDVAPATVTEGDAAAVRITQNRAFHVNLRDAAGNEVAVGGGTQYDEDTVSAPADKITMSGVVRRDTPTSLVDVDGDRTQMIVDSTGRLHVNIGATGTVTANAGSGTFFDGIVKDGAGDTTQANVSSGRLHVDGSGVTQPVSGTTFDGILKDGAGDTTQANVTGGRLQVDGSGVTQPISGAVTVSGTITANAGTGTFIVGDGTGPLTVDGTTFDGIIKDGTGDTTQANVINGNLSVTCVNCGGGMTDGGVFTPDSSNFAPVGGYRDDTTPSTVTEGDGAAARITANRAIHVNLRDASGNELSVGGGTQYDEDTASSPADKLTMAGVVRRDTASSLVDTDGDRTQLQVDASGLLRVNVGNTVSVTGSSVTVSGNKTNNNAAPGTNNVGTLPALVGTSAPTWTDGFQSALSVGTDGSLRVNCTTGCTSLAEATSSGTIDADEEVVSIQLNGRTGVSIILSGTWVGTIFPEVSVDNGTTYVPVDVWSYSGEAVTQSITANGSFAFINLGGVSHVRVRADAWTSGSLTAALRANGSSIGTVNDYARLAGSPPPNHTAYVGGTDGTNLQPLRLFDADSGAGSQPIQGINLRKIASGGSVELGTSADPIRVDPTGTTPQPVSGTVTSNAGTGTRTVGGAAADGAAVSGNPVRIAGKDGSGNTQDIVTDTSGELQVDVLSLPSVTVGTFPDNEPFNLNQVAGNALNTGSGSVGAGSPRVAIASGDGATWHSLISAASTNATNVKNAAGTVYAISVTNINAAVRYLRVYNLTTAPTCSSATGILGRFAIPGNTAGAGHVISIPPFGIAFSTGIAYCITTGSADTDNNAVAAGDIIVNIVYK